MTAECRACRRPLSRPSPDGLGPVCRRRLRPATTTVPGPAGREPLDHAALADAGQLAIPIQPALPRPRPRWARRLDQPTRDLPDIANYRA
ncbi:hypothetical protein [Streptomyces sp. SAJ15]|uniref:hypothetical protein n=1 Tax=Streptomyces sp. SAJ15 TaxID=2011095 RepID=UPI001186661D|nr:hypothetical protein [Streptomyces sp. SAJ15]TVL89806.1 hypothetical protein CD790_25770 [Streptomyces sp. SAJ15]